MKTSTGFKDLDQILEGGFHCPSLICIGGRPTMGKTALMLDIMINLQRQCNEYIYFCLEQKSKDIKKFKPKIKEENVLDDRKFRYIDEIIEHINNFSNDKKIYFIDSLEMVIDKDTFQNNYEHKRAIILKLKACCLDNDVTIIFSSQLSRKVEERAGHRPIASDLRDCGAIEDMSDTILFILRREYYDANDKPGIAEIISFKNKYGNVGTVRMCYLKTYAEFLNLKSVEEENFEIFNDE